MTTYEYVNQAVIQHAATSLLVSLQPFFLNVNGAFMFARCLVQKHTLLHPDAAYNPLVPSSPGCNPAV